MARFLIPTFRERIRSYVRRQLLRDLGGSVGMLTAWVVFIAVLCAWGRS